MDKLTQRQTQVLQYLHEHLQSTGFPPTRAEIASALGFRSVNAAEDHLKALHRKGAIQLTHGASRGIRLLQTPGLPVIGKVSAGLPILSEAHIERHYHCSDDLFTPKADYLLRVQGMSMKDCGIMDGDLLAVQRTHLARDQQIVVIRIDDEVTVKRFKQHGQQILLSAENPDFETQVYDVRNHDIAIEGIGVGVIRNAGMP